MALPIRISRVEFAVPTGLTANTHRAVAHIRGKTTEPLYPSSEPLQPRENLRPREAKVKAKVKVRKRPIPYRKAHKEVLLARISSSTIYSLRTGGVENHFQHSLLATPDTAGHRSRIPYQTPLSRSAVIKRGQLLPLMGAAAA